MSNSPVTPSVSSAQRPDWKADVAALAGILVHEIKNPLSTLSINIQLLLEDWKEPTNRREERAVKRLRVMASEVDRVERIMQSFLRFTERHELNVSACSLNDCLEELAESVAAELQNKRIELRLGLAPGLPDAAMDPDLIRQVFLNLIRNAVNAMEEREEGELILRTRLAEQNGRRWVVGEVVDTGCGISRRAMERIFDLYYSTTSGGHGLGLATSKRITEEHGGWLDVQSEEGRGSQFSVFLPIANASTAAPRGAR